MTKVLDDEAVARAFRAAERDLAEGRPDTLAGRFNPAPASYETAEQPAAPKKPRRRVAA